MLRSTTFFALAATGACGAAPTSKAKATNAVAEPKLNSYNWTDCIAPDTPAGFTDASDVIEPLTSGQVPLAPAPSR